MSDGQEHIAYERYIYAIPYIIKEKYDNNAFVPSDFKDNLKLLDNYFKHMFIKDYRLTPIEA